MGSTYSQPDFKALNKVISACMNEKDLVVKYNKKDQVQVLMSKASFLRKFIEESVGADTFVA
jgi:hypothetical protein